MLLYQRIDYSPPVPGQNFYVRIPMSSTLWTVIEIRGGDKSPIFPSRIIEQSEKNSSVFAGIELGGLLRNKPWGTEYRIQWRTVADPDDLDPKSIIALPLGRNVTFTFSHGNSTLLSLSVGGVDVVLDYNISSRVLSTSWFTVPFTTSWTLEIPKKIMTKLITGIWNPEPIVSSPMIEDRRPSWFRKFLVVMGCCADPEEDPHLD